MTVNNDSSSYTNDPDVSVEANPSLIFASIWILRLACASIAFLCPWANYKLIKLFQTRRFYKESSAKWYIIFKAVFDITYISITVPIIICLTYDIDLIHRNILTCKLITYAHYLCDDLISMLLTLLCFDRMLRITCGYHFRQRFSLTICIITTIFFTIIHIHHLIRLQHRNGFCHKIYLSIWNYDFDIYYSLVYTSITWSIIFISLINLTVSIYCDRVRRSELKKPTQQQEQQLQKISQIFLNGTNSSGFNNDQLELLDNTDDIESSIELTIEQENSNNESFEKEQQDNIDLQITVCVIIVSASFLACNLPNFIIFIVKFIYESTFSTIGHIFVYISIFPLFIAHTISYFIYNHLAARLFPNNSF
ncbi:unnamed protein product [Rotaria sordida]|uniref:G-protein coupled receptors family 1 profile domain-containing protein n=1 Tax=Rotaria sordida TaxID=392033 RepID=A0A814ADQ0_9BILA|nr:unnamed protein product [Rotaria sordida]CAF3658440.1 unnamed protein product [Rotaria sordida]